VFADVQEAQEYPDRCLLADDGQDVCTDTSMIFAKDRLGRVAMEVHERVGGGLAARSTAELALCQLL
jgi:hypothetical protein